MWVHPDHAEPQSDQQYHAFQKYFRNTLVTPAPHTQGKNMNKHLDKKWPQMLQNRAKFGSLGAILLFMFLPCVWGLGLQKESPTTDTRFYFGICFRNTAPDSPVE